MKSALTILLTVCIVLSLFFFIQATNMALVVNLIQKTGYKFSLLVLITGIAYLFGTISWRVLLGVNARIVSTGRLFLIRHIGEIAGMLNPTSIIGGDALKVVMLKKYDIPEHKIISSLLFSRGIMMVSQLLLFVLTSLSVLIHHTSVSPDKVATEASSGLVPLFLTIWKNVRWKFTEVFAELRVMLRENKRILVYSSLFASLHWLFGGLEFFFILKFLGLEINMLQALVVDLGVVLFKAAGAFIPGQLGIEEYGNKFMLMAIGMPQEEVWVAASILRRARQFVWIAFGVFVYFIVFNKCVLIDSKSHGDSIRKS